LRVYVAPCGIGLGHITRTVPIVKELESRGNTIVFSTYLDGLDYAKSNGLPHLAAVPISFRVTSDGAIDFKMTAASSGFSLGVRKFLRQVVKEIQFIKAFKPDVVFSDSRASSLIAARLLRIPVVLMLNQFRVEIVRRPSSKKLSLMDLLFFFIANIGWLFIRTAIELVWVRSSKILIPDFPQPYTICHGNLVIPKRYGGKVLLIGPIVEHNRTDDSDTGKLREELGLTPGRPVIYAAVSGPRLERQILVQLLMGPLSRLSRECTVILSRGEPDGNRNPRLEKGMSVYDWVENQTDLIRACDVVISRAGHGIIMKSLVYAKPMVLVPIPDHTEQYSNAGRARSLHVAETIDQSKLSEDTLITAVHSILDSTGHKMNAISIRRAASSLEAVAMASDIILGVGKRA